MDLSLHDALTDGAPQLGPDNPVRRDFMASLEKETFDDKVGETVGKTDYRPLLDGKDGKGKLGCRMDGGFVGMGKPIENWGSRETIQGEDLADSSAQ